MKNILNCCKNYLVTSKCVIVIVKLYFTSNEVVVIEVKDSLLHLKV